MKIFIILLCFFAYNAIHAQTINNDPAKSTVVNLPDSQAEYPGGLKVFQEYILTQLQDHKAIQKGKAVIQFTVDTDGSVIDARIIDGLDAETNEQLINIVTKSEKWKPAVQNGKYVKAGFRLPVTLAD